MTEGFLNILKPPGMSSHDVISVARRVLGIKKIGHAGTLDPGAAGVLPVAVGRAARLVEYLSDADKSYRAELTLGMATDSGDDMGQVIERCADFALPTAEQLETVLQSFVGEIVQVPPAYSAIKINGQRACDLARQNIAVEIPERRIRIHRIELLAQRENVLLLDVDCSKGTYIRTLCADIGTKLGIPATMSFLVRTRVGDFSLADACTLEELAACGSAALLPAEEYLSHLASYTLADHRVKSFLNGLETQDRSLPWNEDQLLRVYGQGRFLGIGRFTADSRIVRPEKVFY